jgi:hypothetical protein
VRIPQAGERQFSDHGSLLLGKFTTPTPRSDKRSVSIFKINVTDVYAHLCFRRDIGLMDHLCGLVVRVPGYRSRSPGSIPGATRFSEK